MGSGNHWINLEKQERNPPVIPWDWLVHRSSNGPGSVHNSETRSNPLWQLTDFWSPLTLKWVKRITPCAEYGLDWSSLHTHVHFFWGGNGAPPNWSTSVGELRLDVCSSPSYFFVMSSKSLSPSGFPWPSNNLYIYQKFWSERFQIWIPWCALVIEHGWLENSSALDSK